MFLRLLLLFTIIPFVELALLIEIGRRFGLSWTLSLVIGTGLAGAMLVRSQGLAVWRELRAEVQAGRVPAMHLLDALLILAGGLLLLTPGLLTDVVGFLALLPPSRAVARLWIVRRFQLWVETGSFTVTGPRPRR